MGALTSNPSDGFALMMAGVICLSWGLLLLLFWSMRRQAAKRDRAVDALLEEVRKRQRHHRPPPNRLEQPWERDPDWWKHPKN
jgi:hypothetical protein